MSDPKHKQSDNDKKDEELQEELRVEEKDEESGDVSKIHELEEALAKEKDAKLRALADAANMKSRFEKERIAMMSFAQTGVLVKVLDIIDDFNLLLESDKDETSSWKEGVKLIYQKLLDLIKSEGVEVIDVHVGDAFDPRVHEAIGFVTVTNDDENKKVAQVAAKGYKRTDNDSVVRSAKVIVNNK